ncbi:MAG: tetratricopeptide repeat protein [Saprospiraceae bacterium]
MSKQQKVRKEAIPTAKKTVASKGNTEFTGLLIPSLILAAIAFLLFSNTLSHGWALDDYSVIKDNYITQQGTKGISTLMSTEYRYGYWNSPGSLYRPLSLVMFAIEWQLYPDNPWIGHFMNVVLYSFSTVLLFLLLVRLLKNTNPAIPFCIVALYMAHPTHVEVVANIKSRDEILALLFSFSALFFFVKYIDTNRSTALVAALFSYLLAMFSKENAITFLAVFPLAIYFFRDIPTSRNLKSAALMLIPAILFLIVRQKVLNGQSSTEVISALDNAIVQEGVPKLAGALAMMFYYLKVLIFPLTLVSDMGFNAVPLSGWSDLKTLSMLAVNIGILAFAYQRFKRKDPIAFGILFFYITFSISSNILLTIGTSYGERLLYAASLGFIFALVSLLYKYTKTTNLNEHLFTFLGKSTAFTGIIAVFFLFFAFKTYTRNPAWKDSYTLYETDVQTSTEGAKINYHYGLELTKKGRDASDPAIKKAFLDKALIHFEKALSISPNYHDVFGEMGLTYMYKGDNGKAMENFQKSIAQVPDAKVYSNMGMIYFQQNNILEAQRVYEKAIQLDTRYVDGYRNLGSALAMQGKFTEAIPYFKKAIEFRPNEGILYFFLGSAYRDSGDAETGQQYLNKAYALDPKLRK